MQARSERLDVELYRTRHEVAGWQRQADEAVERERALQHELQHERAAAVQRVDAVAHERDQLLRALKLFQHSREENSEAAAAKEDALRVALTQASQRILHTRTHRYCGHTWVLAASRCD